MLCIVNVCIFITRIGSFLQIKKAIHNCTVNKRGKKFCLLPACLTILSDVTVCPYVKYLMQKYSIAFMEGKDQNPE